MGGTVATHFQGLVSVLILTCIDCNVFHHIQTRNSTWDCVDWLVARPKTESPIDNFSSDQIKSYIQCSTMNIGCFFTSRCPLCNPINNRWVAEKYNQKLLFILSTSMNIAQIRNWGLRGKWASKPVRCIYYSQYDRTRTTKQLDWVPDPSNNMIRYLLVSPTCTPTYPPSTFVLVGSSYLLQSLVLYFDLLFMWTHSLILVIIAYCVL